LTKLKTKLSWLLFMAHSVYFAYYYVITSAKEVMFLSLFICLSVVCLLATLRKNFRTDLHEIFREG